MLVACQAMGIVSLSEGWCTSCKQRGDLRKTKHGDAGKAAVLGEVLSGGGKMCQHRQLAAEFERMLEEDEIRIQTPDELGLVARMPSEPPPLSLPLSLLCTFLLHVLMSSIIGKYILPWLCAQGWRACIHTALSTKLLTHRHALLPLCPHLSNMGHINFFVSSSNDFAESFRCVA